MNRKRFKANPLAQSCAAFLMLGSVAFTASSVWAVTEAGEEIRNQATVTYEDAAGNAFSATSNEAIVRVAQVYSATLGVDVDINAARGTTVYLPYILTNTGNGTDTFDLNAINGISGGDDIDSTNITIYNDANGNGDLDPGPLEPAITEIELDQGDFANLLVEVVVPSGAIAGQTLGVTLLAQAREGSTTAAVPAPGPTVTDLSAGGGRDGFNGTNESLITVTDDAVIDISKSAVHDPANNQISYTLTVQNNGAQPARNVVIFDGLPENTTLVTSGISGLVGSGDVTDTVGELSESVINALPVTTVDVDLNADGDLGDTDELDLGLDLNNNGVSTDSGVEGIFAIDAELPAGNTVSLTFTVSYDPDDFNGGDLISNQAHVSADTDNDPVNGADILVSSNTTTTAVDTQFGVTLADTGVNGAVGANDGGDDDGANNGDQLVDQAAAGGVARFDVIVTNTGNSNDTFALSISPTDNNFPTGTVFAFSDETGLVPLGGDTGSLAPGEVRTIVVTATLPATASGPPPAPELEYQATVVAVSDNDPSVNKASSEVDISLTTIVIAEVDIHNSANGVIGTDEDPLVNVSPTVAEYAAVTTFAGQPGTFVDIPLYIDNESGASDSYVLDAGSSFDGTTLGNLPPGWTVEFFIGNGSGTATGAPVTATAVIPGGDFNYEIIARVNIPNDSTQAVNDFVFDNDGDGNPETLDSSIDPVTGNVVAGDGDGDYPIFFQITSLNTGATDIKLDAIDVNDSRTLSLVIPSSSNVDAGNSVVYTHTLTNNGNVTEVVELTGTNSQTGWIGTLEIDTNGDGVADTAYSNLVAGPGAAITVQQNNGVDIVVNVTDIDGDGIVELELLPGFSIPFTATVSSPANAPIAQVDAFTITATNNDPTGPSPTLVDQTTVVNGQVEISKTVAVDTDCLGGAETPFLATQTATVEPGQCAIWQVEVENSGSVDALNVIITDAVTQFSDYVPGSLMYCLGDACTPATVTDATDADEGTVIGSSVVFYVGTGINPAAGEGGLLVSGQKATAQFKVQVQ